MHYYQFNIGDYASHTRHLTPIEDIAYRRLLDVYYLHEQPLNECSTTVARLVNMRDYVQEVEAILNEFFVLHEGEGWRNSRADAEIQHFKDKQSKASAAGKASAARRSIERKANAERTLNECSTDEQPTNNHKPITNKQESNNAHECAPRARRKNEQTLLADWMNVIRESGEKMIPADDTIWNDGVPKPYLHLAWKVFVEDMTAKRKKAKDWRAQFRTYVRKDYLKLWAVNREGQHYLTTAGKQAAIRMNMGDLVHE